MIETEVMAGAEVLLLGNPNTGKTTLFNRLTGGNEKVGNYPGVTVDRHVGRLALGSVQATLVDLPGTYSLSGESLDERVSLDALAGISGASPAGVVVVVDANQLERNLYLALQVVDLGLPTVIALNFADELRAAAREIDTDALARALDAPVVSVSARHAEGIDRLRAVIEETIANGRVSTRPWTVDEPRLEAIADHLPAAWAPTGARRLALARWAALSLGDDAFGDISAELRAAVRTAAIPDEDLIVPRYAWIERTLDTLRARPSRSERRRSDRVDRLLLHPVLGLVIFLGLMTVLFQALFTWADPMIGVIETAIAAVGEFVARSLPVGVVRDFLVEGVIAGVGAVVVFLPQIVLLFLALGLLEDSGYMSRIVALMDRAMKSVGLEGRAFVPMLSGLACAIPAIMATRTMERHRDRLLTMMVVPLMTCAARLPVYGLLIAATIPPERFGGFAQGGLLVAMYLFGIVVAFAATFVLGKTVLKGEASKLVIEMPPYRIPHLATVVRRTWSKCAAFLKDAGTVILVCTIAMWVLLSYPKVDPANSAAATQADAEVQAASLQITNSFAGRLGHGMEPVIEPLGFDWRVGIGLLGAFAAREVFVSTMGVVYGIEGADEEPEPLRQSLARARWPDGRPVYTPLVCLSLMVFFALACQCMSTLAVVKRETGTWRWPAFLFTYMTVLAWVMSFLVYQGGRLLGLA
ncbi:MAG: ferrous iron transport protein B [Planctomycetota bacterium]